MGKDRGKRLAEPFLLCAQKMWDCSSDGAEGQAGKLTKIIMCYLIF